MPTPIGYSDNPQFNAFVSFASQKGVSGQTTLESVQGTGVMSIKAKSKMDFVGNIGRSDESKAVNKNVRDLFMNSVLKMFRVSKLDDLPDVVKAAMKPEDFKAQGKPLTARRVLAVQTAVKQNEMEILIGSEMGIDVGANKELRDRIHTAVAACGNSEEAYSMLQENYREILFEKKDGHSSDGPVLRGDRTVRALVKDLPPAIEWLREEIKAERAPQKFFDVARPFLVLNLQDHGLKQKLRTCFTHVRVIDCTSFEPIQNLASSASAQDIHAAADQLDKLVYGTSGPSEHFVAPKDDYGDQLFANLVLTGAFPNKADLLKVQTALHSETASKLARYYGDRVHEYFRQNHLAGVSMTRAISSYDRHAFALDFLRRAVDQLCDGILSAGSPVEKFGEYVDTDFARGIRRAVEEEARVRR